MRKSGTSLKDMSKLTVNKTISDTRNFARLENGTVMPSKILKYSNNNSTLFRRGFLSVSAELSTPSFEDRTLDDLRDGKDDLDIKTNVYFKL